MKNHLITNTFFEGERPLFASKDMRLENVKFYPGESAVKHSNDIEAYKCEFMCKYPFWHNDNVFIERCLFTVYGRAAIWYSKNVRMIDTLVEAPKMFREMDGLYIENTKFTNGSETLWSCRNVELRNVEVKGGDYIFMNGKNLNIDHLKLDGNYSFQDAENIEIRNSYLNSKDAFWNTKNVTIYDSVINGEYLGWHSKNLRLINCTVNSTQALCYADNLVMENCKLEASDLCFEYSTLQADINGNIVSIKNPKGGIIIADSIGEIIIDENCINPGECKISTRFPQDFHKISTKK
ncbi:MAG: DUF3737 family protein [Bacteroidales bacterium]|jgi:hypothetical protein|nr:DUF3737 family protein [Bacteroidales bacterium]